MAGAALGFLAGLGQAAQGLPQGLQVAQLEQDKARALAQQQQQFEESKFANVPESMLPNDVRRTLPVGATSGRFEAALIPGFMAQQARERALEDQRQQSAALSPTLRGLGPEFAPLADVLDRGASAPSKETVAELLNIVKLQRQGQQQQRGMEFIRGLPGMGGMVPPAAAPTPLAPGPGPLGAPRFMPTGLESGQSPPHFAENPPVLQAGQELRQDLTKTFGPAPVAKMAQGPSAAAIPGFTGSRPPAPVTPETSGTGLPPGMAVDFDPASGSFKVHLKGPTENKAIYTREDIEDQIKLEEEQRLATGGKPFSSLEKRQRYNDLARQLQLAAGGAIVGAGTGLQPPAPGTPTPAPPPLAQRAPQPTPQETKEAADAQTWVKQARAAADQLDSYLQQLTPQQRASFAMRTKVQGMPIIGSVPGITSKHEQEITSAIGNLQLAWERASGGLRMASSPQMQDRIRSIFGNPTNAATPQHLRTIAGMMEQEIQQRAATEQQAGRQPIAVPPGGLGSPAVSRPASQGGYVEGKSYRGSDGKVYRFTGGTMVPQ